MRNLLLSVGIIGLVACSTSPASRDRGTAELWNQPRPGQSSPGLEAEKPEPKKPNATPKPKTLRPRRSGGEGIQLSNIGKVEPQGDIEIKRDDGTPVTVKRQKVYLEGKNDHDLAFEPYLQYTLKNGGSYDIYSITFEVQALIGKASVFKVVTEKRIPKYKERIFNFILNAPYENDAKPVKTEAKLLQVLVEVDGEVLDLVDAYKVEWR